MSLILTWLTKGIASRLNIVDVPGGERKLHDRAVPLLGGLGIFFAFWIVAGYLLFYNPIFEVNIFKTKLLGVFLAGAILMVVGILDDKYNLSAKIRFPIIILSGVVAVLFGLGLGKINNPFGGIISLGGIVAAGFGFVWLVAMMFTTKILDGLDGLSTGITLVGSLVIFFLTNTHKFFQPNVALLAIIFGASCLGFLIFNFHPAKIFLGEGGSLFLGLMLGTLAIISGGKVATALLVMAIPFFDLLHVAYARWKKGRSIFKGDREHLHFKLVDMGLNHRSAVLLLYFFALVFGVAALYLQSKGKILALGFLIITIIVFNFLLAKNGRKIYEK